MVDKRRFTDLREVLRAKKDSPLLIENSEFLENLNKLELIQITHNPFGELVTDYVHSDIKRRASTIGVAYDIAFKLLTCLIIKDKELLDNYLKTFEYYSNPEYFEIYNKKETIMVYTTIMGAISIAETLLDLTETISLEVLASVSVKLAWLEVYYKTTFMPKDLTIIENGHEVDNKLIDEVVALLEVSHDTINMIVDEYNLSRRVVFNAQVASNGYNLFGTAPIIVGDTIFDLKTTGTKPTKASILRDLEYSRGLLTLNSNPNDNHAPILDVNTVILYYPRFDNSIRFDLRFDYE